MHADEVARMTASASQALVAACAPAPGERWLDLASGAGDPSRSLALAVRPAGLVLASDGVADMVAASVARTADQPESETMRGLVARGEQLPLADGSLDGVSCRFGAMFFDDLAGALREARRVLRDDGRLAWLVWGRKEATPYFTAAMAALDEVDAPPLEADPGDKTPFELCEPDALAGVARDVGLSDVREERQQVLMQVEASPDELLDLQIRLSDRVEQRAEALEAEQLEAARRILAERVRPWARGAGLALPAEVVLVTARR
jgi:ubiquinone/menaquinone biosynthesis C-methylase UbiE